MKKGQKVSEKTKEGNKMQNFKPDFLLIPYEVHKDKNLEQVDKIVFSVIYWLEHLRDGKCTASNEFIAEIALTTAGSVANSLLSLEKQDHISRKYKDEQRAEREYITTKHSFRKEGGVHPQVKGGSPTGEQIKNTNKEKNNTSTPTAAGSISSFAEDSAKPAPDAAFKDIQYVDENARPEKKPPQNKAYEAALAYMAKKRAELTDEPFSFTGNKIALYRALKDIKKLMSNERAYEIWEELCKDKWWQERGFDLWTIKSQFIKKGK